MRVALESDTDWREAIARGRRRGAELVCLPHLSFGSYMASTRDRAGLELAERAPSANMREAVERADGAWVAASAYESEGEGVFYLSAYLGGFDPDEEEDIFVPDDAARPAEFEPRLRDVIATQRQFWNGL